jgi:DUF917 family protein
MLLKTFVEGYHDRYVVSVRVFQASMLGCGGGLDVDVDVEIVAAAIAAELPLRLLAPAHLAQIPLILGHHSKICSPLASTGGHPIGCRR